MEDRRKFRMSKARVERALVMLWGTCNGKRIQQSVTLTATEYKRVLKLAKEPENEELFGRFYGRLRVNLEWRIYRWIDGFEKILESGDNRIRDAAMSNIRSGSLTTINYPLIGGARDARTPNALFYCGRCERKCRYPNLVVEIGWAQSDRKLAETAKSYIRGSKGITRTVITLGMNKICHTEERNAGRKCANDEENETDIDTFSVWRANDNGEPIQTIADQKFRDKGGRSAASVALELSLKDFICRRILASAESAFEDPVLGISSEQLCKKLDKALVEYREYRGDDNQEEDDSEVFEERSAVSQGSNRRSPKRIEMCIDAGKARSMTA
ncbi:hypothetical protein F5B21DRAFT_519583 [Xylaria acuta]|nr:hypothetical protein F5B21DRAFT_519583 [Xylaria acuta]